MSISDASRAPGNSRLWQPPIVGIITFVLMFVGVGLAHTMMVLIEHELGRDATLAISPLLGFAGIVMLWYGIKSKSENFQTCTPVRGISLGKHLEVHPTAGRLSGMPR